MLKRDIKIPERRESKIMIPGPERGFRDIIVIASGRSNPQNDWSTLDINNEGMFYVQVAGIDNDLFSQSRQRTDRRCVEDAPCAYGLHLLTRSPGEHFDFTDD